MRRPLAAGGAPGSVDPSRVAVAAEWTETIVSDRFALEPGDCALEHHWLDQWYSIGGGGSG
jgi:hypothetical protein